MMTSLNICGTDFYDLWHPSLSSITVLLSIHFSSIQIDSIWADHPQTKHTPADPMKLGYQSWISWPQPDLWHLPLWRRMENAVEETDNRGPKGDKVPLRDNRSATCGKLYLRSLIQLGLMHPPFCFSILKSKKAMLILLEGKTLKITISGSFVTSSELSHNFHTGFQGL